MSAAGVPAEFLIMSYRFALGWALLLNKEPMPFILKLFTLRVLSKDSERVVLGFDVSGLSDCEFRLKD